MSTKHRLDKAYNTTKIIPFDDDSKFILFSDCHRGDNSFADDFAHNRDVYVNALTHYLEAGFSYCELGDGDELWETQKFDAIFQAHKDVYLLLKKFHDAKRLHMIWGNHDMVYKNPTYVKKNLSTYFDKETRGKVDLFPGIEYHESIRLEHKTTKQILFLTHGHQADWWNYIFWRWSRFLVRFLWKPLNLMGVSDPTSPAKNHKGLIKIEQRAKKWISENNNTFTITGHTHRPRFPQPGNIPFFNDGSCVHPRSITGLEIEKGTISLIKWHVSTNKEGILQITKTILEGPVNLNAYQ